MCNKIRFGADLQTREEKATCRIRPQVDPRVRKKKPLTPALYFSQQQIWAVDDLPYPSPPLSLKPSTLGPRGAVEG